MLQVNTAVRILPTREDGLEWHGKEGTFVKFDEHADEGDCYGVSFLDDPLRLMYFWRDELEEIIPRQHRRRTSSMTTTALHTRELLAELLVLCLFLADALLIAGAAVNPRPGSPLDHAGILVFGAAFGAGFAVCALFLLCEILVLMAARSQSYEHAAQPKA